MKRALIAFLMLMLAGAPAYAELSDRVGHLDLGIQGGGAFLDGNGLDDSGWIQANTSYGVLPWLGIGAEGGWTQVDNTAGGDTGVGVIMGTIIGRWVNHPWDTRLVPYGVLGLGGLWSYAEVDNQEDQDESSFAWKLGAGIDWWINDNWILNFEVGWLEATDETPVDHRPANDDELGLTTVVAGLKFVF